MSTSYKTAPHNSSAKLVALYRLQLSFHNIRILQLKKLLNSCLLCTYTVTLMQEKRIVLTDLYIQNVNLMALSLIFHLHSLK